MKFGAYFLRPGELQAPSKGPGEGYPETVGRPRRFGGARMEPTVWRCLDSKLRTGCVDVRCALSQAVEVVGLEYDEVGVGVGLAMCAAF